MVLLLILALCLSTPLPQSLLKSTSEIALDFQQKCVQILPRNSDHHKSLASLVCGEKITDEELKQNLSKTSLIHIFVISGSHLLLLDELLSIFGIPFSVRFLFLATYSLFVGWQAPAVRALIALGVRPAFRKYHLHFPADLMVLIAGFVTLLLFPDWWTSLSLQMSWCAALALSLGSLLRLRHSLARLLASQIAIFFFMSAPLWGLGSLHPLSIVYNIFLAPAVSYILLPLAFLATACSWTVPVFDFVMSSFAHLLPHLTEPIELTKVSPPSTVALWGWIFSWHILLTTLRLHLHQGKDSP